MTNIVRKQLQATTENVTATGGRIVISTANHDRHRDRVNSQGGDVTGYMRNPVVMWGHDYTSPTAIIGHTTALVLGQDQIEATFELRDPVNDGDPQHVVRALWSSGLLRAASIGFTPLPDGAVENADGGIDYERWELLEWSLVPIPANRDALRLAVKALGGESVTAERPQPGPRALTADEITTLRLAVETAARLIFEV